MSELQLIHVDDDAAFTAMTAEFLERSDASIAVRQATEPAEALTIVTQESIDCVVSDFDMPGTDGIEFLEQVRAIRPDLPFILFTGKGSEEIASEAIAAGATEYLQKGVGSDQYELLRNRIENAVAGYRADRERRRNERRFRTVFEDPNRLVHLLDDTGRILRCNRTSLEWISADDSAVTGQLFWEAPWWIGQDRSVMQDWVERGLAGEYVDFDINGETPQGDAYYLSGSVRPVRDESNVVTSLIVTWRDVSEERRQQARLAEKSRALEAVLETVDVGIVMKDVESRYQLLNSEWRSCLGIADDADIDTLTDFELFAAPVAEGFRAEDRRVMQSGEPIEVTQTVPTVDGERTMLTRKTPVYTESGTIKGVCAVSTDITDRVEREAELAVSRKRLQRQNGRLEEFAEIVSHDLRSPLTTAAGRLELADDTGSVEHIESAREALDRAIDLIDNTLTLAKEGRVIEERVPVELAELVDSAWKSMENESVTLVCDIDGEISADPDRLTRLFENLFANAIRHGGASVTVTVGRANESALYIADDGPGIPADKRDAVFERGMTTEHAGTGYGLAIVERIVDAHDWEISIETSTDGGARFLIHDVTFLE